MSAPGDAPGTKGGDVEVASNGNVVVAATAKMNASGKAGGGTVAIGTTLERARDTKATPTLVAANTTVKSGATIKASATQNGNGGRVVDISLANCGQERHVSLGYDAAWQPNALSSAGRASQLGSKRPSASDQSATDSRVPS